MGVRRLRKEVNDVTSHGQGRPVRRRVMVVNGNETVMPYRVAPLGLAFVASAVRAAGYDVVFEEYAGDAGARADLRGRVESWRPDYVAVGIRNLDNSDYHAFESYLDGPAGLVRDIRRWAPWVKVIAGGPAATVDPDRVMREVGPDHVILGEGEESLPEVIARLEVGERLPAVVGSGGGPYRVERTEQLPAPRLYEWVSDLRSYLRGDAGYPLQTKRGCPLKCTYCTYGRIEGAKYRFLDPEAVADEVEGAMGAGVRDFEFVDSTFNLPPSHAMRVLAALQRRGLEANFIGTGLNPGKLPAELLAAMRSTGFRNVLLTAESASDTMLRSYQKSYGREALGVAVERLRAEGMTALWVFLLGGPGETPETVAETLGFIEEHVKSPDAVYITSGIRIYPGSPLSDQMGAGQFVLEDLRRKADPEVPDFFYSHRTPPGWLEETLRAFQRRHPHVMLSCEGHSRLTQWGLKAMALLPFPKPYWQYIPFLNRVRRMLPFAA
jgi:radical SAM superfamily enzyme YgiQ (UPF0313 family)